MASVTLSRCGVRHVEIRREADVPDGLWTHVRSMWDAEAINADTMRVPVEAFLPRATLFGRTCRIWGVHADPGDAADWLRSVAAEYRELDTLLANPRALSADEAVERLRGTRFTLALRSFQKRDLGKLLALQHGANFSVPGAGKTAVTYALYEAERMAARVNRLLVVGPISAFDAWNVEAGKCFATPPNIGYVTDGRIAGEIEVCLVNYHRLDRVFPAIADWAKSGACHVVLDEAHRMKRGWSGEWGRTCLQLAYMGVRRDVLTGTPAPQGIKDLAAIFDFVWPTRARRILPPDALRVSPPSGTAEQVAQRIKPLFVRTTKSDLRLRKPTFEVIPVPMGEVQSAIYEALRNRYRGQFNLSRHDKATLARMGQAVMHMLQAATNPGLLPIGEKSTPAAGFMFPKLSTPPGSDVADLISRYEERETPPKFEQLARILADNAAQGRKTLVWTNFRANFNVLKAMVPRLEPAEIHGGVLSESSGARTGTSRESELDRFRRDPNCLVLLANPAATAEGISLHRDCHHAVYLDRTFNAGQYLQSLDRIHRLGMDPAIETRFTFLVTSGTIDTVVDGRIQVKAARLGALLDDRTISAMALPSDDAYTDPYELDEDDLRAIFGHLAGQARPGG